EVETVGNGLHDVDVESGEAGGGGVVEVLERRVRDVRADGQRAVGDEVEGGSVDVTVAVVRPARGEGEDETGGGRGGKQGAHVHGGTVAARPPPALGIGLIVPESG